MEKQVASGPGFYTDAAGVPRWWNGTQWTARVRADSAVPGSVKRERLDAQIESFERAGYRLESVAGFQAIVSRSRPTAGLWSLPILRDVKRRSWHRVVITVDDTGAVRFV